MNITSVVQALWVATVFSTALFVSHALSQNSLGNQTPTLFQSAASGLSNTGTEASPGTSLMTGEMSIAWPNWQESL